MGNQERGRFSDLHVVKNQGRNLKTKQDLFPHYHDIYFAVLLCFWDECWELH